MIQYIVSKSIVDSGFSGRSGKSEKFMVVTLYPTNDGWYYSIGTNGTVEKVDHCTRKNPAPFVVAMLCEQKSWTYINPTQELDSEGYIKGVNYEKQN